MNQNVNLEENSSSWGLITDEEVDEWRKEIALIDNQLLKGNAVKTLKVQETTREDDKQKLKNPPDIEQINQTKSYDISPTSHNCHVLNLACQEMLKQMEKKLLLEIEKNRKEQQKIVFYLNLNKVDVDKCNQNSKTKIKCLGIPYFKDLNGYPQPHNPDVEQKLKNREPTAIDYLSNCSIWDHVHNKKLKEALQHYSKDCQLELLQKKKNDVIHSDNNDTKELLKDIEKEILLLKSLPLKSFNLDLNRIDWMKISSVYMEGKYSDMECQSNWLLNLQPKVNKSKWSKEELRSLDNIAKEFNFQDWDKVAQKLNTNRSALQCCVKYQSRKGLSEGKWTKEEDEKLQNLIKRFQVNDYIPWPKVSWYFKTRSTRQCTERYRYHLVTLKKGQFTKDEDKRIILGAKKYENDFNKVASLLPGRVAPQVRARYEYLVALSMPTFSKEEDELLVSLIRVYSNDWKKVSSFFDNRSALQCRKRWCSLQKELLKDGFKMPDFTNEVEDDNPINGGTEYMSYLVSAVKKKLEESPEEVNQLSTLGTIKTSLLDTLKDKKLEGELMSNFLGNVPKLSVGNQMVPLSGPIAELHSYLECGSEFIYGPKPRNPKSTVEEFKKLCMKMRISMSVLSAEYDISSKQTVIDLAGNCGELDIEDVSILSELCKEDGMESNNSKSKRFASCSNGLVFPPNFTTLTGLRSLIIGRSQIKELAFKGNETSNLTLRDSNINPEERLLFSDAKLLWKARLKSLFMLPFICGTVPLNGVSLLPHVKKTKKSKALSKRRMNAKIRFMNEQKRKNREAALCTVDLDSSLKTNQKSNKEKKVTEESNTQKGPPSGIIPRKRGRPLKQQSVTICEITKVPETSGGQPRPKRARMIRVLPCET